jgi:hypothetical protein
VFTRLRTTGHREPFTAFGLQHIDHLPMLIDTGKDLPVNNT